MTKEKEKSEERKRESAGWRPLNMSQPSRPRLIITLQLLPLGPVAREEGPSRAIAETSFNASDRPRGLSLSFHVYAVCSLFLSFFHSRSTNFLFVPWCDSQKLPPSRFDSKKLLPGEKRHVLFLPFSRETRQRNSGNEKNLNRIFPVNTSTSLDPSFNCRND